MINYRNEVVRLLLEICILLLKAGRKEIMVEELDEITKNHFGIKKVSEKLFKKDFARYCGEWDKEKQEWNKMFLVYPIEVYQAVIQKMDNKELAYIPENLLNGDYRDYPIRNKVIWGIGEKAIVLVDGVGYDEECYHPRYAIGRKRFFNYRKNKEEAEKLASEILGKYGK